eukprot:CAMPEP_0113726212 /NCGR_PEP_ID=MMETSP0038_2-20120614/40271_1 /TAXON_ID=2898 /ORGANISM="Cryptomonas paramecium" /LENGTH=44 /DNA_ID=CAMNT_0000656723 /DNA_START=24 /DNA_END=155 /DNA_ORIENTATION=- /assembly_acc=CAM_ASM_000170
MRQSRIRALSPRATTSASCREAAREVGEAVQAQLAHGAEVSARV